MNWPLVSRKRLEDAERRLAECDAERRELLRKLLERDSAPKSTQKVSVEEDSALVAYTTPHDHVIRRFEKAGPGAKVDRFKARMR